MQVTHEASRGQKPPPPGRASSRSPGRRGVTAAWAGASGETADSGSLPALSVSSGGSRRTRRCGSSCRSARLTRRCSCRSRTRRGLRGWRRGRGRRKREGRRSYPRLPPLAVLLPALLALGNLDIILCDSGYMFMRQFSWLLVFSRFST